MNLKFSSAPEPNNIQKGGTEVPSNKDVTSLDWYVFSYNLSAK
jgi:hypothetical protein